MQDCYSRALNRHEATRLLGGGGQPLDEEGIRAAAPTILSALRLHRTGGPNGPLVLDVDIP